MLTTRRQQEPWQQRQSGFCHIRTRSTQTSNVIPPNDLRADLEGRPPMPRPHLAPSPTMSLAAREEGKKIHNHDRDKDTQSQRPFVF